MNEQDIKNLISQAVDGELLSDAEHATVQSALQESADLRAYEAELLRLKEAMDSWQGIGSSPDWEQRMNKTMASMGIKEEKMAKFNFSRSKMSTGILVILVVAVLFTTQVYIKRGVQGRLRSAADDIGDQFSAGNTNVRKVISIPRVGTQNNALETYDRKIIRIADMQLLVQNCLQAQDAITAIVRKFNGLIINSHVNKYPSGSNGAITFQVVPNNLDAAIIEIKNLGGVQNETSKADDVTGQYVDTKARLGNMRTVRDRLIKLASEKTDKVTDILEVERELARVTGEIEAMEARLKNLSQSSAMATVTVNFYEKSVAADAPWFSSESIKNSFRGTLKTTVEVATNTFNAVIIVLGFIMPVVFWSLLVWGIYLAWRKFAKK